MTHTPEKKTRKKTELPELIFWQADEDPIEIAHLDLMQLIHHRNRIDATLADVPRLELERRAIRKAIISKA